MIEQTPFFSVVTPTFYRPTEVVGLLKNLSEQTVLPKEVVLVDGAPADEKATEEAVRRIEKELPFEIIYFRYDRGTAVQRNAGINVAKGEFIAFIDDDVRLEKDFLECIFEAFCADTKQTVGGIVGYRTNRHFKLEESERWRWYKRLKLLTVYEPGRYDFSCGYPINNNMQTPFAGTRAVDFMTTACAVWRRKVFDSGLRFHPFFRDYGILEDAHLSLRAGREWKLLQCGDAHCEEMHSPNGRVNRRKIGYKCVVNYYFVFQDIVPLSRSHKFRFWRYQLFEIFRIGASAIRRRNWSDVEDVRGRAEGILAVMRGAASGKSESE